MTDVKIATGNGELQPFAGRTYERDLVTGASRQVLSDYEVFASLVSHCGAIWAHVTDSVDGQEVIRFMAELPGGKVVHTAVLEGASAAQKAAYAAAVEAGRADHEVTILASRIPQDVHAFAQDILSRLKALEAGL